MTRSVAMRRNCTVCSPAVKLFEYVVFSMLLSVGIMVALCLDKSLDLSSVAVFSGMVSFAFFLTGSMMGLCFEESEAGSAISVAATAIMAATLCYGLDTFLKSDILFINILSVNILPLVIIVIFGMASLFFSVGIAADRTVLYWAAIMPMLVIEFIVIFLPYMYLFGLFKIPNWII